MFYSLRGTLIHTEQGFAVVECGGVGYKCSTSLMTMRELPQLNSEVTLYTHISVREDAIELFGFSTPKELEFFRILTAVSGVGPKVGIAILSEFTPEQIAVCITSSDSKTLTRASGVGNKLAQRVILELKDKMKKLNLSAVSAGAKGTGKLVDFDSSNAGNAMEALAVLGYDNSDVAPVLAQLDSNLPVEELIRLTLVEMGKR
ncbi:MAG: Holliday junction branch migration protein RuvA [Lachnospiraceae bacterium]|nr:Holliday junction branch migration protein RuvA [Lachnospiraceae bacterium]